MIITPQMLNGEIPVTEEELRFLAENHETYDLTLLDVSQVTDFSELFQYQNFFNQDISNWNVSNGTNFSYMFYFAKHFNQPIGNWNVSNGTHFYAMFQFTKRFNQPIGNWDVSNGIIFSSMFQFTKRFNQDISNWNVSNGINFNNMFCWANRFNQPIISKWKLVENELLDLIESNFQLSKQYDFKIIGKTESTEQLQLIFKDSPESPFKNDFNYKSKELTLIKAGRFYGFIDENKNAYEIDINKTSIEELINICDIKAIEDFA